MLFNRIKDDAWHDCPLSDCFISDALFIMHVWMGRVDSCICTHCAIDGLCFKGRFLVNLLTFQTGACAALDSLWVVAGLVPKIMVSLQTRNRFRYVQKNFYCLAWVDKNFSVVVQGMGMVSWIGGENFCRFFPKPDSSTYKVIVIPKPNCLK